MNPEFAPHGGFRLRRDGQILISEVDGPWNTELVALWARQVYPHALEGMAQGPQVAIAIVSGSLLSPPEAMALLRESVVFSVQKLGFIAHIVVADPSVEGRNLIEPTYAKIYQGVCAHDFFDTYEAARDWALTLLKEAKR